MAFLEGKIGFTEIAQVVAGALEQAVPVDANNLENILAQDQETRRYVQRVLAEKTVA